MKFHLSLASIFLGIIALIIVPMIVLGQTSHNVQGYAWANMPNPNDEKQVTNCHPTDQQYDEDNVGCGQGLGWIDLAGVSLNSETGIFSGNGNSQFGGTLSFNPETTDAPQAPLVNARVDAACLKTANPCAITGWIKFTQATDGWDGWVKMSGATQDGGSYGVRLDAPDSTGVRKFSGYAWGDHVAGWIDFKYASVKIEPPEIPGCTDSKATNYNPNATKDDGSCKYDIKKQQPYCGDPKATPPTGANYMTPAQVEAKLAQLNAQNDGFTWEMVRDDSTCVICPEGTSWNRDLDRCVSEEVFVCENTTPKQKNKPANSGSGDAAIIWEVTGKTCIPKSCKPNNRTLLGVAVQSRPVNDCEPTPPPCTPGDPDCPNDCEAKGGVTDSFGTCCQKGRVNPITGVCLPGYRFDEV